nr:hypothetical 7.9K protein - myxoma virus [Myxoma virus]
MCSILVPSVLFHEPAFIFRINGRFYMYVGHPSVLYAVVFFYRIHLNRRVFARIRHVDVTEQVDHGI